MRPAQTQVHGHVPNADQSTHVHVRRLHAPEVSVTQCSFAAGTRAVVSVTVRIGYGDIPYYIGFCHVDTRFSIAK